MGGEILTTYIHWDDPPSYLGGAVCQTHRFLPRARKERKDPEQTGLGFFFRRWDDGCKKELRERKTDWNGFDWLVHWFIGWLVGWNWLELIWLVDWLVGWLVGIDWNWFDWLVGWLIGWLELIGTDLIGWLVGWLIGWLELIGTDLIGWLVGWLVDWLELIGTDLIGWLVGWLVGWNWFDLIWLVDSLIDWNWLIDRHDWWCIPTFRNVKLYEMMTSQFHHVETKHDLRPCWSNVLRGQRCEGSWKNGERCQKRSRTKRQKIRILHFTWDSNDSIYSYIHLESISVYFNTMYNIM